MDVITAPLLAIVGGLVVASAQFFYSRFTNKEGKLSDRTATAYSDYLSAVARLANPHQMGDYDVMDKATHQLADAKCRITVYGDAQVIRAIAVLSRLGNTLHTPEQINAFIAIIQAMRQSNGGQSLLSEEDVMPVLFGHSVDNPKAPLP